MFNWLGYLLIVNIMSVYSHIYYRIDYKLFCSSRNEIAHFMKAKLYGQWLSFYVRKKNRYRFTEALFKFRKRCFK